LKTYFAWCTNYRILPQKNRAKLFLFSTKLKN
jgi:hypothetical protein